MSKLTDVFSYLLEGASTEELTFVESYEFVGKTTLQWIDEAENHPELISEDPIYAGEPASHSIMEMARTSLIMAREAYKKL